LSGLGDSPIGFSTPFGVGAPDEVAAPPTTPPQAARFVDPISRDYVLAADGSYERMPELRQRVLLAVSETKGSSTVSPDGGVEATALIDASFERRRKGAISNALAFLVNEGAMRIDDIAIDYPRPGHVQTTVAYTDLKTGIRDTATA